MAAISFRATCMGVRRFFGRISLRQWLAVLLISAVVGVFWSQRYQDRSFPVTGDEPSYAAVALNLALHGRLISQTTNSGYLNNPRHESLNRNLPATISQDTHCPMVAIVSAPFVFMRGYEGGRRFVLALVAIGLGFLGLALSSKVNAFWAAAVTGVVAFVEPVHAASMVLYPDAFGFFFSSLVVFFYFRPRTRNNALLLVLIAAFMPFFQLRFALIPAAVYLLLCYDSMVKKEFDFRFLIMPTVAAIVAGSVFLWYQIAFTGGLISGASGIHLPLTFTSDLAMGQLFGFRHGLIANAPIMSLAFIALFLGLGKLDRTASRLAILILAAFIPFIFGAASESPPARFWMSVIPFLAMTATISVTRLGAILLMLVAVVSAPITYYYASIAWTAAAGMLINRKFGHIYALLTEQLKFIDVDHLLLAEYIEAMSRWYSERTAVQSAFVILLLLLVSTALITFHVAKSRWKIYTLGVSLAGFVGATSIVLYVTHHLLVQPIAETEYVHNCNNAHKIEGDLTALSQDALALFQKSVVVGNPQDWLCRIVFRKSVSLKLLRFLPTTAFPDVDVLDVFGLSSTEEKPFLLGETIEALHATLEPREVGGLVIRARLVQGVSQFSGGKMRISREIRPRLSEINNTIHATRLIRDVIYSGRSAVIFGLHS